MGIAAYNRGTEVVSREISAALPDHNKMVVDEINAYPRGAAKLFAETVVRPLNGKWLLMNRQDGGFSSSCYEYETLRKLFAAWNCYVVGYGADEHSFFYRVA